MSEYKLLIGGSLVDGDETMDVTNPATETVFATCPRGSERQMNAAVAAAKAAFPASRKMPMQTRRDPVNQLVDAIDARRDQHAFRRGQAIGRRRGFRGRRAPRVHPDTVVNEAR